VARKRKKKKSHVLSFLKIIFWLSLCFVATYYLGTFLRPQADIFYPGFQINIPQSYEIHGIDVSRYQQTINWEEVARMEDDGIKIGFAFIKATEGVQNVDPQFRRNWLKAEQEEITKGAYHFFIPGKNPAKQAENFMQIVTLKKGDLPPVLDIEIARRLPVAQIQKEVKIWLDAVEDEYGVKPIIYTNIDFYQRYFNEGFEEYPLWIAHYLQPNKPRISKKWSFWQHSEKGRVNGIKSAVDFNVFYGDSSDFSNLLKQ
jgi:lysozyme